MNTQWLTNLQNSQQDINRRTLRSFAKQAVLVLTDDFVLNYGVNVSGSLI